MVSSVVPISSQIVPGSGHGLQVELTSVPFIKYPGLQRHLRQLAEFSGATELSGHLVHACPVPCPVLSLYVLSGQAIASPAEHQEPMGHGSH